MSYRKATDILPIEILQVIQEYVDGDYLYIPKKKENIKEWGTNTKTKEYTMQRNKLIKQIEQTIHSIETEQLDLHYNVILREVFDQYVISLRKKYHIIITKVFYGKNFINM